MNNYLKYFLMFATGYAFYMVISVGLHLWDESKKVDAMISELPAIEYDYEFMQHLNECKKYDNLTDEECNTIFGMY